MSTFVRSSPYHTILRVVFVSVFVSKCMYIIWRLLYRSGLVTLGFECGASCLLVEVRSGEFGWVYVGCMLLQQLLLLFPSGVS